MEDYLVVTYGCSLSDPPALAVARKEAERYKRYYFHHEYDKWEAEIKTATVLKMQERLKTYLREVADGEIGDGWIDQIAKEILEENNGNL